MSLHGIKRHMLTTVPAAVAGFGAAMHATGVAGADSSAGIAQIKAGTVDFGASGKPLDAAELDQAGLAQFPDVIGGIVPVLHVLDARANVVQRADGCGTR